MIKKVRIPPKTIKENKAKSNLLVKIAELEIGKVLKTIIILTTKITI
jgi:hypothetical protein